MRSQHKHNRRPRGNKSQDNDQYSSSHHRRTSSSSNRDYYDGYNDGTSHSRSRHDEDPWYSDVGRYREDDVYRRDDDYEASMRRDSDWRTRSQGDPQYLSMRDDWTHQHYDHSSSYHDSSSWNASASRDAYDGRGSYYDDWPVANTRGSSSHGHDDDRHLRHGGKHNRDDLSWSRERKREKSTPQIRYPNDSGWDVRRRDSGWDDKSMDDPQSIEERAWEPAPSWKSSHRNEADTPKNQPQSSHQRGTQPKQNQYTKGGKRNQNTKQRRDWRNDDSNLNNWTRRDFHSQNRRTGKTQQQDSQPQQEQQRPKQYHSRSRSRSPAESYRSHLSSRGRSRSLTRSPVPKRRRREFSPTIQSRTPSDRDTSGWVPRQERVFRSPSPLPRHDFKRPRSVSSVSSRTSARSSRSESPNLEPRPVHRLPSSDPVTSEPLGNATLNLQHGKAREPAPQPNGKLLHMHEEVNKSDWLPDASAADTRHSEEPMPPPSIIPPRNDYPLVENTPHEPPLSRVNITSRPSRPLPGFKPISRPQPTSSSSLRKFFPGDDDDAEQPPSSAPSESLPPSPLHQQQIHQASAHPVPVQKRIWPSPGGRGYHPPSWKAQELTTYDHASTNDNGQTQVSRSPQPQSYHGPWNEDRVTHPTFVSAARITHDPRKHPAPKIADQPPKPPQPSPAPRQASSPLAPPISPPVLAGVLPSSTSTLDEHRLLQASKVVAPPGKPVYSIVAQVGEGTFGKVYKARNSVSNVLVALKRIRMETEKDGFPVTAMREIKLLQSLRHDNIVRLYEMIVSNGSVYMVFEYMDHDLTGILSQTQFEFTAAHLKSLSHQMLAGLAYLHHKGVIHRDIKGSNILINNRGELKLGDFGLARFYQKRRRTDYTNRVITLWYRPPELLFGATVYGPEVDMWSAGCIMLELFTTKPVFQGNDEIHQLDVIHKILGTPTTRRWPALVDLPWYELARPRDEIPNRFRDIFQKWMSPAALDLAEQLLTYDPLQRITAAQAMETPYFTQEAPTASRPIGLASLEGEWHELETKRERAKKRKKNESSA